MTLDRSLLDEAKSLGINISQAAEAGVRSAIQAERGRKWREENAQAITEYNALVEKEGIPLTRFRKF